MRNWARPLWTWAILWGCTAVGVALAVALHTILALLV